MNSQSPASPETCNTAQLADYTFHGIWRSSPNLILQITTFFLSLDELLFFYFPLWKKKTFLNQNKEHLDQIHRNRVTGPLEDDEGRSTVCRRNGWLSQRWFITGTVTECSWQPGHRSPPHRQTGHCYLAGRSELSLPISTVTPDESTTHQRISAQPGERRRKKTKGKLRRYHSARSQGWGQAHKLVYIFCDEAEGLTYRPVDGFQLVAVNWITSNDDDRLDLTTQAESIKAVVLTHIRAKWRL